jgi:predicted metalloenzyme YecM
MWKQLKKEFPTFMDKAFEFTKELGIDPVNLVVDHAALRFANAEDVDTLRKELETESTMLSEAIVAGRPIMIYKLNTPLKYKVSTPKVEGEQLPNTSLAITKYKGLALKFHCYTIEQVVTNTL